MKKAAKRFLSFLIVVAALYTTAALANSGSYVGVGLGKTVFQTPNESLFTVNTPSENFFVYEEEHPGKSFSNPSKLGGRLFGGYNFNSYFGVETGFAHYARSKYMGNIDTNNSSLQYTMNAVDLILKAYLPIGEGKLNIYASGSLAHTQATSKYDAGDTFSLDDQTLANESSAQNKMRPVIGIGTNYDIPRTDFSTGLEFNRFQGIENLKTDPNAIPSSDMLTFNLSYHLN